MQDPKTPPAKFTSYQVFMVVIMALLQFTVVLDFMVLSPLGAQLLDELHINTQQFGMDIAVPGRVQHMKRWKTQPIIFLGFTYRFGETQKSNKQRERKNNDAIETDNSGEMM